MLAPSALIESNHCVVLSLTGLNVAGSRVFPVAYGAFTSQFVASQHGSPLCANVPMLKWMSAMKSVAM